MTADGITKVLNALPTAKLIDTVSAGIGRICTPKYIKRMADAKAYEINKISEALRENSDVIAFYDQGNVSLKTPELEELAKRTAQRMTHQELQKQYNIESVVAKAYAELEKKDSVSDEPVDSDWINSFFDFVARISNEKMQILWGKILAGEIERPNSFSIRTLDTMRKLSQAEAEMFATVAPYILNCDGNSDGSIRDYFLVADMLHEKGINERLNYQFPAILDLSTAGLISSNSMISVGFELLPGESNTINGFFKKATLSNVSSIKITINTRAFILTSAGKELLETVMSLNKSSPYEEYMNDCIDVILRRGYINKDLLKTEISPCNEYVD